MLCPQLSLNLTDWINIPILEWNIIFIRMFRGHMSYWIAKLNSFDPQVRLIDLLFQDIIAIFWVLVISLKPRSIESFVIEVYWNDDLSLFWSRIWLHLVDELNSDLLWLLFLSNNLKKISVFVININYDFWRITLKQRIFMSFHHYDLPLSLKIKGFCVWNLLNNLKSIESVC